MRRQLHLHPTSKRILQKNKPDKRTSFFYKWRERRGCLAHSRLTGLRTFFSLALLASKKAPSPSAHSRSNFDRSSTCEFSPLYSTIPNKKISPTSGLHFFINGGNDEARTRDLMRDRHAL